MDNRDLEAISCIRYIVILRIFLFEGAVFSMCIICLVQCTCGAFVAANILTIVIHIVLPILM